MTTNNPKTLGKIAAKAFAESWGKHHDTSKAWQDVANAVKKAVIEGADENNQK